MLFEKQEYQEKCVQNIIDVLSEYDFNSNSYEQLKGNLKSFYSTNPLPISDLSPNTKLDIKMETGTGKTFTYLKTIFELNKIYGQKKFIIFVPRKAIREGVLQNIALTSDYFSNEYGKRLVKYTYDGGQSLAIIKHHYLKNQDELSVLVLTNSSIDKTDKNLLHYDQEDLSNAESVFKALQNLRPIIFIDEPHLLKGEAFTKVFNEFNSLYLRFGATFPSEESHKISNMIYSLDSISSFKNHLVKRIRVNTIITHDFWLKVNTATKKEINFLYFQNNEEKKAKVKLEEDIGQATGLAEYNSVNVVNVDSKSVYLSNGQQLEINKGYDLSDEEISLMIRKTIDTHFEKEENFFNKGIKTLSLFFIPTINDFRGDSPRILKIFEKEYKEKRKEVLTKKINIKYKKYLEKDFNEEGNLNVHEGYFSGDGKTKDEKESNGINLILKDKERLLSLDTPLRFIFSVWALQEGWDNPNVFQICKLSQTNSETSRRQQIGRGLRISVNQEGKRITYNYVDENTEEFFKYNTLDVIVSGREKNFIEEIQKEINEDSYIRTGDEITEDYFTTIGLDRSQSNRLITQLEDNNIIELKDKKFTILSPLLDFITTHKEEVLACKIDEDLYSSLCVKLEEFGTTKIIENGNIKPKTVNIKQDKLEQFKKLWETINRKAKIVYKDIEEDNIIECIVDKFNQEDIRPVYSKIEIKEFNADKNIIENKETQNLDKINFIKNERYKKFIIEFAKEEKLPLLFITKLFNKIDKEKVKNNPREAKIRLKAIIKDEIHKNILQSVTYNLESEIKITTLQHDDKTYRTELKYTEIGRFICDDIPPDHFLFDKVVYDSDIEKIAILDDPQKVDKQSITVFAKLPRISIPTPYKHYNPDFAYLIDRENKKTLFLVVETKGYNKESDIPDDENMKIKYAEKFFNELQKATPDIKIVFKKRINKADLSDLLKDISEDKS